jgi:hypothetical protein
MQENVSNSLHENEMNQPCFGKLNKCGISVDDGPSRIRISEVHLYYLPRVIYRISSVLQKDILMKFTTE